MLIMRNATPTYVWSILDELLREEGRETMDQFGVLIIVGNKDLLRRSVSAPTTAATELAIWCRSRVTCSHTG